MVLAPTCQATFHTCKGKVDSLASFENEHPESTIEKFEKFVTALLIGYLLVSSSLPKNFNEIQYKKDSLCILFNSKAFTFVGCYFKIFLSSYPLLCYQYSTLFHNLLQNNLKFPFVP
ncbi:hypothetical protein A8F95_09945 [Bacillus wudalianchiensis]|uniref:Uncharacterized protein n=1 Tax=Pseudobacillus wudalianchiensis TaxID=1743143 RepID=A0A1B9AM74_9BACI|nr:hypothetical protein A8F95_09945 [Bacillus wudalianchiensis]